MPLKLLALFYPIPYKLLNEDRVLIKGRRKIKEPKEVDVKAAIIETVAVDI